MFSKATILKAVAVSATGLLLSLPAAAHKDNDHSNRDHDRGNGPPVVRAAPGPAIGVGLPFLAAAGGLLWLRRAKRNGARSQSSTA